MVSMIRVMNGVWVLPFVLALAGCGGAGLLRQVGDELAVDVGPQQPEQVQALQEQLATAPHGEYVCSGSGVDGAWGPQLELTFASDGQVTERPAGDQAGEARAGQWAHAPERAQVGFSGETHLDYGYYDAVGGNLFVELKPGAAEALGLVSNLICEPSK